MAHEEQLRKQFVPHPAFAADGQRTAEAVARRFDAQLCATFLTPLPDEPLAEDGAVTDAETVEELFAVEDADVEVSSSADPPAGAADAAAPIDPFDYSYCGGKPVYPVIGFNVATSCGPRNQIGLGRRGHLMWFIPSQEEGGKPVFGKRLLPEETLKKLTVLAEVVQLADAPPAMIGAVMYDLGVDFQGRPYKRVHAPVAGEYSPANALYQALMAELKMELVLPACEGPVQDFRPTLWPAERAALQSVSTRGMTHAFRE